MYLFFPSATERGKKKSYRWKTNVWERKSTRGEIWFSWRVGTLYPATIRQWSARLERELLVDSADGCCSSRGWRYREEGREGGLYARARLLVRFSFDSLDRVNSSRWQPFPSEDWNLSLSFFEKRIDRAEEKFGGNVPSLKMPKDDRRKERKEGGWRKEKNK